MGRFAHVEGKIEADLFSEFKTFCSQSKTRSIPLALRPYVAKNPDSVVVTLETDAWITVTEF